MKKIMFNDKYGLTNAVLNGRKTMTRRIIKAPRRTIEGKEVCGFAINKTSDGVPYEVWLTGPDEESLCQLLPTYKVGEEVAIAQAYNTVVIRWQRNRMRRTSRSQSYSKPSPTHVSSRRTLMTCTSVRERRTWCIFTERSLNYVRRTTRQRPFLWRDGSNTTATDIRTARCCGRISSFLAKEFLILTRHAASLLPQIS